MPKIIGESLWDGLVLAAYMAVMFGLEQLSRIAHPPDGMVFFEGARLSFRVTWLFDAGHIGGILTYIVRSLWRFVTSEASDR